MKTAKKPAAKAKKASTGKKATPSTTQGVKKAPVAKKKTTAKTPAAKAAAAKKVAAKKAALARRGGAGRALKGGPKTTAPVIRRGDGSFRLPEDVRPEAYHIHVVPDLNRGIFRGEEIIEITLDRSRSVIQVHAADL